MFEKVFKISLLIVLVVFLVIFYMSSQKGRYEVVTVYEGSVGIFDGQFGVLYLLDLETDQWTVIKPFSRSQPI